GHVPASELGLAQQPWRLVEPVGIETRLDGTDGLVHQGAFRSTRRLTEHVPKRTVPRGQSTTDLPRQVHSFADQLQCVRPWQADPVSLIAAALLHCLEKSLTRRIDELQLRNAVDGAEQRHCEICLARR